MPTLASRVCGHARPLQPARSRDLTPVHPSAQTPTVLPKRRRLISVSTTSLMRLYDEGQIEPDKWALRKGDLQTAGLYNAKVELEM